MGAAMARRLHDCGHPVVTWSRSGLTVDDLPAVAEAADAAGAADVVLLCLFDGPACAEVVASIGDRLAAGTVVVNTTTMGVAEADTLASEVRATGAGYVHAPVMGSVPAVESGTLTLLLGAESEDAGVAPVLDALGRPVRCGSVAAAAAAKLLANGVLGDGLLALRAGRQRADELGIEHGTALTVLEQTLLGRLVGGKRDRIEKGDYSGAHFTVGALAKDLVLLADLAPSAGPLRDDVLGALDRGTADADDDVVALSALPTPTGAAYGLSIAPEVTAPAEVLAPLEAYVAGHATGDPAHHRRAFLPTAHVEGIRQGEFVSWPVDDYCALFRGEPAPDEPQRRRRIDRVDVTGTVATARMTLHHGPDVFTDVFLLVRAEDEWRIANKAYDRADRPVSG